MQPCRLILSPPADGAMNMALDEALLESAASGSEDAGPVLRIYQWARPTLSLGYFQRAADREHHQPSRQCELIRRPSGGGAILHDRELTYALVLPEEVAKGEPARGFYEKVHNALIAALNGIGSLFSGGELTSEGAPFLCFERRSDGDVILGENKIAGSAQRRRRGAILQHGSVLLARSSFAPELPGIGDLTGEDVTFENLAQRFAAEVASTLGFTMNPETITTAELEIAEQLRRTKYATEQWTLRR